MFKSRVTIISAILAVGFFAQADDVKSKVKLSNPVPGSVITQKFGRNNSPQTGKRYFHEGVDLAARIGTNIVAPLDGTVELAAEEFKERKGSGRTLVINHGEGYKTYFYHLNEIKVKEGISVKQNEAVGTVGETGEGTGPHLHFEVRKNGKAINPFGLIGLN